MIEPSWNTEAAVDARVVFYRHVWNSLRLHKGEQLIAPDIEEQVSNAPAFFDLYRVRDYWLESQNALVELSGLVQVKGRQADVGKSSMTHANHSSSTTAGPRRR